MRGIIKPTALFLIAACSLLVWPPVCPGVWRAHEEGFSIDLPESWVPIPSHLIEAMKEQVRETAPNAMIADYEVGYRLGISNNWFSYPYLLVVVNDEGPLPARELSALKGISRAEVAKTVNQGLDEVVSTLAVGRIRYDRQSGILWTSMQSTMPEAGRISGLVGIVLTTSGFVQVEGYTRAAEFTEFAPVFRQAIQTMRFSGDTRRLESRGAEGLAGLWQAILVFVLAIAVVFAAWMAYAKRKREPHFGGDESQDRDRETAQDDERAGVESGPRKEQGGK
ncbi:MAG: hypothetical protein ACLFOY_15460 [Desulfatibacillaceae bacterium]